MRARDGPPSTSGSRDEGEGSVTGAPVLTLYSRAGDMDKMLPDTIRSREGET